MSRIIIEIPSELKGLKQPIEALVQEAKTQVQKHRQGGRVEYAAFEQQVSDKVAEIERATHGMALEALDIDAAGITMNGVSYRRVGRHAGVYRTRSGPVHVMRTLYRRSADRNGATVNTVSVRAQTVQDEWLSGTARQMAYLMAQGPSRQAEATAQQLGQLPYSRSSFERIGHAVAQMYRDDRGQIDEKLIEATELCKATRSLSVSIDRVSIPMEEPRARPRGRPRRKAAKRPIETVHRMGYCATVTQHDRKGDALQTLRYGTMPARDAYEMMLTIADDVQALMAKAKGRKPKLMLLADGAPEMWNLMQDTLGEKQSFGRTYTLVDFWHVIEKLTPAAKLIYGDDEGIDWVRRCRLRLLNHRGAAKRILTELINSGMENRWRDGTRPVHDAITYLKNHGNKMDYASARAQGLPIGSGNVEATCKTLVALRMKRCGARWKTETGENIITLRALLLSDHWDLAMLLTLNKPQPRITAVA